MPQRPITQPNVEDRVDEVGRHRLHITVPRPRARLNLGMPWYERLRGATFDNSTNRFGYQGISLLSEYYFFGYVEKDTLLHTEKTTQLQTGKAWLQYAGDSQWIATKKNATYAAEHKMTLVAGAGQGPITPPTFGMDVRTDPYNNLYLHYCVDSVMNGVAEFFLGRRRRQTQGLRHSFESTSPEIKPMEGFYHVIDRAAQLLGPQLLDLTATEPIFPRPTQEPTPLHFGYGKPYFTDFDPYAKKSAGGGLGGLLTHLKNGFADLNRSLDVLMRLGDLYENIPVLREVSKMFEVIGGIGETFDKVGSLSRRLAPQGSSHNRTDVTIPDNVLAEVEEWARSTAESYEDTPSSSARAAEVTIRRPPWGWGAVSEESTARISVRGPDGPFIETLLDGTSGVLTNEQIVARLQGPGYEVFIVPSTGDLVFRSTTTIEGTSNRSFLSVGGLLIEELLGPDPLLREDREETPSRPPLPMVSRVPRGNQDLAVLDTASKWVKWVGSWPPDPAGLFAPVVDAARQIVDGLAKVVKMASELMDALEGTHGGAKPTRSSIGIFAKDGISLGTPDRLVSAAGRGYLFVADGGTGDADVSKYVTFEKMVNLEPIEGYEGLRDLAGTAAAKAPKDGGFAVFSNSTTSLVTRTSLDLIAVGSEVKDGELIGKGVARLAATDSVEVAAHRRVSISATAGAKWTEKEGQTQMRKEVAPVAGNERSTVELLGDCIRLGSTTPPIPPFEPVKDEIPWPNEEQKRTLEHFARHVAGETQRVDINASERIQIHLGSHTDSDGGETDEVRAAEAVVERWQSAPPANPYVDSPESLPVELGVVPDLDGIDLDLDRRVYTQQAVEHLAQLRSRLRSAETAPIIEITGDHIKLGFRSISSPSTWGPHVFITKDSVHIAAADKNSMSPSFVAKEGEVKLLSGDGRSNIRFDGSSGTSKGLKGLD